MRLKQWPTINLKQLSQAELATSKSLISCPTTAETDARSDASKWCFAWWILVFLSFPHHNFIVSNYRVQYHKSIPYHPKSRTARDTNPKGALSNWDWEYSEKSAVYLWIRSTNARNAPIVKFCFANKGTITTNFPTTATMKRVRHRTASHTMWHIGSVRCEKVPEHRLSNALLSTVQ